MFKQRGKDLNLLRQTRYWHDIGILIDTDDKTRQKLVDYVYTNVTKQVLAELERLGEQVEKQPSSAGYLQYLKERIILFTQFAKGEDGRQETKEN